jgi:Carboxypeptidase regulatory-like domain
MKPTACRSLLILSILLVNSLLLADIRTTGEISGNIETEDGQPLPGATIELSSENLIQRSVLDYSNDQGFFRFLNLKPGKYFATVSLQGFGTKKYEIDVEVGSVRSLKVILAPSTVTEQVEVTDVVPLIDAKSPQIAVNYTQETVERIPIRREFIDFMDLVPGINDRGAYGAGGKDEGKYNRGSATSAYRLNGVDVSNIDFGSTWVNPSFDTIEEIQVVGIGTSAEYGNYIGATVNVVTKSGTNQLHGGVSYFYTNDDLQSDNSNGIIDLNPQQNDYTTEGSVSLGGPIVKDKVLFFANYGLNAYAVAPFDSAFFNEFRQHHVQGRVDWLLNENNTISGMFNTDPASDGNLGLLAGSGPEIAYDESFRTDTYYGSWNNTLNQNTFVEVKFAGFSGDYDRSPVAPLDISAVTDDTTGKKYGSFGFVTGQENKRNSITGNISHYADDFMKSSHSFKFGMEYEDASTKSDKDQTGIATFFIYQYGPYNVITGLTGYHEHTNASTNRFGAFVQDDVRLNENVTVNLGLRYDRPVLDDARLGHLATFNFVAPRLGLSYDLHGDGKNVGHLHYGRYYDKITTYGPIGYAGTGFEDPINYYLVLTPNPIDPTDQEFLHQVIQPQNLLGSFPLGQIPVDPDLTGPYTDVFNAGYETMVTNDLAVSFDYVYKRDRDFIIQTDRNQHTYEPFQYTNPFTNTTKTLFRQTDTLPTDFILSNDPFYKRNHHFAFVSVRKRQTPRLILEGSLTYQRSIGTTENDSGTAWSVGSFSYHTNPNFTQDPFYEGLLTFDRTWQFKVLTSYDFPHQIRLSADYRWLSGRPWAPVTQSVLIPGLNAASFYEVLLEPRGNRRWESTNSFNLRFSKLFNLGNVAASPSQIEAIVDIFNVFNDDAPESINNFVAARYAISGEPSFGLPQTIVLPRRVRLGARFTF